jgi:Family of unknown function (DUF6477)
MTASSIDNRSADRSRRPKFVGLARESIGALVRAGVESYQRGRHLPHLIPIAMDRLADLNIDSHRSIVTKLARALRAERSRGRAGHWTYDLNRHIALLQAYEAERRLLEKRVSGAAKTDHRI